MIILMRAYPHRGWAHRQRVSTTFFTQKNSHLSCAPDGIQTQLGWSLNHESDALPILSQPATTLMAHTTQQRVVLRKSKKWPVS